MNHLLLLVLVGGCTLINAATQQATLTWELSKPLHTFDSTFVSVNIDTASLDAHMDLTDPSLINIIKQLGDVWLRVGGTSSNGLIYEPNGPAGDKGGNVHINDEYWGQLAKLQQATGAQLLFGLPLQLDSSGKYDPSINATALWSKTASSKYQVAGWSLGNELIGGSFNSAQYASDYQTFASILKKYAVGQQIYGPSAAGFPGDAALTPFITGAKSVLTAITFHAYAFNNCSLDVYVVKEGVEHMEHYLSSYAALRSSVAPGVPLVLEEAATQAGGGCEGLSDRFVSGFWWIHTLGMSAAAGIDRVQRQDIAGFSFNNRASHYMLAGVAGWINTTHSGPLNPHPDWYATVLHKQLAGNAYFASNVTGNTSTTDSVAVHVWCAAPGAKAPSGAITLSFVNMGENAVTLILPGKSNSPRVEYMLQPGPSSDDGKQEGPQKYTTSPPTSLTSDTVLLNGAQLTVGKDMVLPVYPIPGKRVTDTSNIELPSWTYGFVVLENAGASGC